MKLKNGHFAQIYIATFLLLAVYFITQTTNCEAYYMHDDSIEISQTKLITICTYLFIPTTFILLLAKILKLKEINKLYITHYATSLASILLLAITINKPCETINGGNYMFINFFGTVFSYLLRIISHLMTVVIFIVTSISIISQTKNLKNN